MSTEDHNGYYVSFGCGCTWLSVAETDCPTVCPDHQSARAEPPSRTWLSKGVRLGVVPRHAYM